MVYAIAIATGVLLGSLVGGKRPDAAKPSFLQSRITTGLMGGCIAALAVSIADESGSATRSAIEWGPGITRIASAAEFDTWLTDSNERPSIAYFYADWCRPCRTSVPKLNRYPAAGVPLAVINGDTLPGLVRAYAIDAYPTILYLWGGTEVLRSHETPSPGNAREFLDALEKEPVEAET